MGVGRKPLEVKLDVFVNQLMLCEQFGEVAGALASGGEFSVDKQ